MTWNWRCSASHRLSGSEIANASSARPRQSTEPGVTVVSPFYPNLIFLGFPECLMFPRFSGVGLLDCHAFSLRPPVCTTWALPIVSNRSERAGIERRPSVVCVPRLGDRPRRRVRPSKCTGELTATRKQATSRSAFSRIRGG